MNILVLGGGQQGRVIAGDLARSLTSARVTVADVREPKLAVHSNLRWLSADLEDPAALVKLVHGHDLVVGALPSRFGWNVMQAAIEAKRPLVDVSFCAENPLLLDGAARAAGIPILPDCGLAPGLSHLCCGHAASLGPLDELVIYVGGVAADPALPYGYVVTWSLDDLLEEYVRPARFVRDRQPVTLPVFSEMETIPVEGAGTMEAFLSDGLRTLMDTLPEVPNMSERTLRWPGHAAAVRPLVESGRFLDEFRARCVVEPARDLVAMVVRARWKNRAARMTLVNRWDEGEKLTAMARTTALTTSVTAQLVARGGAREPGVHPLERVARDGDANRFIVDEMARRGVFLRWRDE